MIFQLENLNWRDKPKQWGNLDFVQGNLFDRAAKMGIDPQAVISAVCPGFYDIGLTSPVSMIGSATIKNDYYNVPSNDLDGMYITGVKTVFDRITNDFTMINDSCINSASDYSCLTGVPFFSSSWALPYYSIALLRYYNTSQGRVLFARTTIDYSYALSVAGFLDFNSRHTYVGVRKGGNAQFFLDGSLFDTVALTYDTTVVMSTTQVAIFNRSSGSIGEGMSGEVYRSLIFRGALTPDQIAFLHDNPYYLWQPLSPVFYSLPAATTGNISRYHDLNGLGGQGSMTWNPLG